MGQHQSHTRGIGSNAAWATVVVLSLAYFFSFLDRMILNMLIEPVRRDLALTDTQIALVIGTTFAVFYTVASVPLARIADRRSRKWLIFWGVALWGTSTFASGFAGSFEHLLIARMGVGLGEAALVPAAFSIICGLFEPNARSRPMGLFSIGGSVGAGAAPLIGGLILASVDASGQLAIPLIGLAPAWRVLLIVVGLLTLLTLIPILAMREPPREQVNERGQPGFVEILSRLWEDRRGLYFIVLGTPLINMTFMAFQVWMPSFLIRSHGVPPAAVGFAIGLSSILTVLVGTAIFANLGDRLSSRGIQAAPARLIIAAVLIALPLPALLAFAPSAVVAIGAYAALNMLILGALPTLGPVVLLARVDPRMRAQVSALFFLFSNFVAIGLGPTLVALVNEGMFGGAELGLSLGVVGMAGLGASACLLIIFLSRHAASLRPPEGAA